MPPPLAQAADPGVTEQMTALLDRIARSGETVHVYGASTKGNVLLQWYGIDSSRIAFAADRNPDKVGATTLGTNILIVSEEESRHLRPNYYLVLPWHFKREFLERERPTILAGTKMIFTLPMLEVVDAWNIDQHLSREETENPPAALAGVEQALSVTVAFVLGSNGQDGSYRRGCVGEGMAGRGRRSAKRVQMDKPPLFPSHQP